jgi:hypothetical protein
MAWLLNLALDDSVGSSISTTVMLSSSDFTSTGSLKMAFLTLSRRRWEWISWEEKIMAAAANKRTNRFIGIIFSWSPNAI